MLDQDQDSGCLPYFLGGGDADDAAGFWEVVAGRLGTGDWHDEIGPLMLREFRIVVLRN